MIAVLLEIDEPGEGRDEDGKNMVEHHEDEDGNIQIDEAEIMQRWKRYFNGLLNEENPFEISNWKNRQKLTAP